jgi:hypothetical protein
MRFLLCASKIISLEREILEMRKCKQVINLPVDFAYGSLKRIAVRSGHYAARTQKNHAKFASRLLGKPFVRCPASLQHS